jgi:hypothetical protein
MNQTFITSIDPCAGGLGEARALNAPRFANVPQWRVWGASGSPLGLGGNPPNPGFCQRTTHFFLKSVTFIHSEFQWVITQNFVGAKAFVPLLCGTPFFSHRKRAIACDRPSLLRLKSKICLFAQKAIEKSASSVLNSASRSRTRLWSPLALATCSRCPRLL